MDIKSVKSPLNKNLEISLGETTPMYSILEFIILDFNEFTANSDPPPTILNLIFNPSLISSCTALTNISWCLYGYKGDTYKSFIGFFEVNSELIFKLFLTLSIPCGIVVFFDERE